MTAAQFRGRLKTVTASKIVLTINSPGGDVFDGVAIYNSLLDHGAEVVVRVSGIAASAASLVAMAGDTIEIADNAFFMIHNAWTVAVGDRRVLEDSAKILTKIDGELAATYSRRTGVDSGEVSEMMNAETWFTADEAVSSGFADAITSRDESGDGASAAFDLSKFKNVPRALKRPGNTAKDRKPTVELPLADERTAVLAALCCLEFSIPSEISA